MENKEKAKILDGSFLLDGTYLFDGQAPIEHKEQINKEEFLSTELGMELKVCIRAWCRAIEKKEEVNSSYGDYKYLERICEHCQSQWEVYQMAIKQFYGVEYHFVHTDEYFGIVTKDRTDWLLKISRYQDKKQRGKTNEEQA